MQYLSHLTDLGMREEDARVYLCLLRLGEAGATELAQNAGLKRTAIYPILNILTQKGFVAVTFKKSRRLYHATRPTKLLRYYERRVKGFEEIIPALARLEGGKSGEPGIQYIETLPELRRFYNDVLDECKGKSYCIIGDVNGWEDLDHDFFVDFRKRRGRLGIKTKLLLTSNSKSTNPQDKMLLRESRYLPAGYHFKSTIDIYGDKILVVNYKLHGLAVVISIPGMVQMFHVLFDILWDISPK